MTSTGAMNAHGGQESTILALNNESGGNPYGTSNTAGDAPVPEAILKTAFYQGQRLARFAALIAQGRPATAPA